jgi:nucleotide-binding universal stress UspA family protein
MTMFKTIVVAVDGSDGSRRASSVAAELAKSEGAKLVLTHVDEHNIGKGGGELHADEDEIKDEIRKQAEELSGSGLDASVEIRDEMLGGPAHAIAEVAEQANADLIVAGTRGHSPVAGLLLGSVIQRIIHIARCPVLAVPTPK